MCAVVGVMITFPKVGRFRLYDRSRTNQGVVISGFLRCRLCGRNVKMDNQWRHFDTEMKKGGAWVGARYSEFRLKRMESRIAFLMRARRSRSHQRRSRWEYKVGRGKEE